MYQVRVEDAGDAVGVALGYLAGGVLLPFLYAADWTQRGLERARGGSLRLRRLVGLAALVLVVVGSSGCLSYLRDQRSAADRAREQEEAVIREWEKAAKERGGGR